MGLLNKVKNIFFEEVTVEVEEKPKKVKTETPIAKKIELPKIERVEQPLKEDYVLVEKEDDDEVKEPKKEPKVDKRFPRVFDDDDFTEEVNEHTLTKSSQKALRRRDRYDDFTIENAVADNQVGIERQPEPAPVKYDYSQDNRRDEDYTTHGLYEGKNAKKTFTPTPIISPIYGILDKNYKKEDVVSKKEIRLSSAPKKIDLDSVREKAYGDLTNDISQSMEENKKTYDLKEEPIENNVQEDKDDNLLYDLNDDESPAVQKVTVGDAEEYFNELGLEYNVDYKDTTIEKNKGKVIENDQLKETKDDSQDNTKNENTDGLESNLFDLIESMYDEKE